MALTGVIIETARVETQVEIVKFYFEWFRGWGF